MYEVCQGAGAGCGEAGACSGPCTQSPYLTTCSEQSWAPGAVSSMAECRDGVHTTIHYSAASCGGTVVREDPENEVCYMMDNEDNTYLGACGESPSLCAPLECPSGDGSMPCADEKIWGWNCIDGTGETVGNTNGGGLNVATGLIDSTSDLACTNAGHSWQSYSCQQSADWLATRADDQSGWCESSVQFFISAGCCDSAACPVST